MLTAVRITFITEDSSGAQYKLNVATISNLPGNVANYFIYQAPHFITENTWQKEPQSKKG